MEHGANKPDGLQGAEESAYHARSWAAQHIAWAILAALLIAALLGVFGGGGPLSWTRERTPDGALEIRYERFVRRDAPAQLEVRVAAALADAGHIRLRVGREYLTSVRVEWITPPPLRVEAAGEETVYVFAARAGAPSTLMFNLQMQASGRQRARFTVGPDHSIGFTQFVYP